MNNNVASGKPITYQRCRPRNCALSQKIRMMTRIVMTFSKSVFPVVKKIARNGNSMKVTNMMVEKMTSKKRYSTPANAFFIIP